MGTRALFNVAATFPLLSFLQTGSVTALSFSLQMLSQSTPRQGPRGLPSNPRPRSRPVTRSRDDAPHRHDQPQTLSRPLRRPDRSRTPPLLESRLRSREPRPSTHKSDDSASSTTSSLLDRFKLGSGYVSSHTSLEEDHKDSHPTLRATKSLRQRRLSDRNLVPANSEKSAGTGDAIWNRVATVASSLTVSVSKAWTTNITTFAGEETPPGQESRLTRAMKAYHLEKARDPTDLPPWLFDERERRRPNSNEALSSDGTQSTHEISKSRGLREIYDAYRPETPITQSSQRLSREDLPSKATDRLRALRDAKRTAVTRPAVSETTNLTPSDAPREVVTQRPRVGLPSGPRRI